MVLPRKMTASLETTGLAPAGRSRHSPLSRSLTTLQRGSHSLFCHETQKELRQKAEKGPALSRGGERGDCPQLGHPYTSRPTLSRLPPHPGILGARPRQHVQAGAAAGGWGGQMGPELAGSGSALASRPLVGLGRCLIHDGRVDFLGTARCLWRQSSQVADKGDVFFITMNI